MEGILYTIIALLVLFVPMIFIMKLKNKYGASSFDDIFFYKNKLIVFSNVYHSGGDGDAFRDVRISEIDSQTGKITKRYISKYFQKLKVIGEIDNKIWLEDERFCVFDPEKFEIVFMQNQIGEKLEELKKIKIKDFYLNEIDEKVYFLAENGYKYSINPKTFDIEREIFEQKSRIIKKNERIKHKIKFGIKAHEGSERSQITYDNVNICNDLSFIKPDFLRSKSIGKFVTFRNEERIVFIHYDTLNYMSEFNISAISNTGKINWTFSQKQLGIKHNIESEDKAKIEHVYFKEPNLIIVFKSKRDNIICIDVSKGSILWNTKL